MLSRFTIVFALTSICFTIGGPILVRLGILPPLSGMVFFAFSGILGFVAVLLAAIVAIRYQAYFPAMIGTLGLLPLIAVVATVAQGMRYPAINDITTTPDDPPVFVRAPTLPENTGRNMAFPDEFVAVIKDRYGDLAPLPLDLSPERAYRRARDLAEQKPFCWLITQEDPTTWTFEAVAQTRLFRWKDDIVVHIRPNGATGSLVDMRSKSREGKSDLGANAKRIHTFFDALLDE